MASLRQGILLALALKALANPLPIPTPPPLTANASTTGESPQATALCTTWLTSLLSGFTGDFTPEIAKTIYTSTETVYSHVPCNGCALSITTTLAPIWGGIGPQERVTGTVTATEPTRITSTVCASETPAGPPHGQIPHGQLPRRHHLGDGQIVAFSPVQDNTKANEANQAEEVNGPCITTFTQTPAPWWVNPSNDGTLTVYSSTATVAREVNCGSCSLAVHTASFAPKWGGVGPAVQPFYETITATEPTTVTSPVCRATAQAQQAGEHDSRRRVEIRSEQPTEIVAANTSSATPGCTYTKLVAMTALSIPGGVKTVYNVTATHTSHVDCSGCSQVAVSTPNYLNPGPAVFYNATVTETVTPWNTTRYMCLKTPSVVLPPGTVPILTATDASETNSWLMHTLPPVVPTGVPAVVRELPAVESVVLTTTVVETITRKEWVGGTSTFTKAVSCEDMHPFPTGAIPRRGEVDDGDGEADEEDEPTYGRTRTSYVTETLMQPGTRTRTLAVCEAQTPGARPRPSRTRFPPVASGH